MLGGGLLDGTVVPVAAGAEGQREARLLRFPDIHGDRIVFVYAGDIWIVPAEGGVAHRLTTHEGLELFPKFSPDGLWIAFSAEYGGNRQVYVMPAAGGTPRQLTFYNDVGAMPPRGGWDYWVLDWTPDGKKILFRANRLPWSERMGRPYLVPVDGGMEEPLPVPESGGGMFSPDGTKLVYAPIDREFRTWKRYRGGRAQDIWIYDLAAGTAEPITDFEGTDNQPMWVDDTIYFTSDRERTLNLYAYDPATRATRKVTHHDDFDVLWPAAGQDAIVYECGGYLYRFDPESERSERVPVRLTGDYLLTRPGYRNVQEQISDSGLSPSGKRAVFTARGEVFTVPAEKGPVRNLTRTPGVRELSAAWSPDGRWIAYLSDETGEYEIHLSAQDGSGEARRVTTDGDAWRFPPVWSPDGKKLAFGDTRERLRYVEVESGRVVEVDRSAYNDIATYAWSPDSRWLAYSKAGETQFSSLYVFSLEEGRFHRLTDGTSDAREPVFDPQGRYLYFLSDRDFDITFSGFEFNYLYSDPTRVYAAILKKDGPPLLAPKSDEEEPEVEGEAEEGEKAGKEGTARGEAKRGDREAAAGEDEDEETKEPVRVEIDFDGLADRVVALPGDPGAYRSLAATEEAVFYLVGEEGDTRLERFSLEDEETKTVLKGIAAYVLSGDGKKVLYQQGDKYGIVDAEADQSTGEGLLDLSGLEAWVDPRAEWRQIFVDGWRLLRDWFYDPATHGLDWPAMREKYGPLVEHVAHRADLDYILGELGGELNAGHVYVEWGDFPRPERRDNGLLGAEIAAHESGYFRVAKIYRGENWHEDFRSPLTEAGVEVREGDLILAVDGRSTREVRNFYELLQNRAGKIVTLLVNDRPDRAGAREERVRPIAGETNLRYLDWARSRRELVDRLSAGRIGYIHLPDTAFDGNRELHKWFYPQAHREALILDVRYNGGGFIPDRMIELLARTQLSFWARRGIQPFPTPSYAHRGPKVCLINAYAGSGGDAFPYYFRKLGLGPLIGRRTWGGLIGLSGNPELMDGGTINVPTFRFFDTEGQWAVEGIGVAPDIDVLDRPDLVAKGRDPTLEKAVEVLLEELRRSPPPPIETPAPPRPEGQP